MPCFHPLQAWRTETNRVHLSKTAIKNARAMLLPCSKCVGCRAAYAKSWALRCHLESLAHPSAVFSTLTYDEQHKPPTLDRRALQVFNRRLRKKLRPNRLIRFFASGEYGELTGRPHYHVLLYGCHQTDADLIEDTWQQGHVYTYQLTPAAISYTAGYTAKKLDQYPDIRPERVDPETGEVYRWQLPFRQMSLKPGIGANAKQWPASWRNAAIYNGHTMPVPRFLHESWKAQATPEQIAALLAEKEQIALTRHMTPEQREQAELDTLRKLQLKHDRRKTA